MAKRKEAPPVPAPETASPPQPQPTAPAGYPPPPGYPPVAAYPPPPPGYPPQPVFPGQPPPPPQGYAAPPPGYPSQPGYLQQPGYPAPPPGYAGYGPNPMSQMLQTMQLLMASMGGAGAVPLMDSAAQPFAGQPATTERDPGIEADIIRPAVLDELLKEQRALPVQEVLDLLCLTPDGKHSLGGIPQGSTIAFCGPPGKGKTRSALEALLRVAASGMKCAYVVAEEGFRDDASSGRDDLCSRMAKIGMRMLGVDEPALRDRVLANVWVLLSQYHRGQTWDDFVARYRYLGEKEAIRFVVIDSLNALDPTKVRTADNLNVLKTYNHEHGITCLTIGQIRDTGAPAGGEQLMHTADAVFLLEEMSLGSKEEAARWGGNYRDRIDVIRAVKSVTTPVFPHPLRVATSDVGTLRVHEKQPPDLAPLPHAGAP